jgi:SAM-dependent methyltransferase
MTACRGCGAPTLEPVVSLGHMPAANAFVSAGAADEQTSPLDVYVCPTCTLVQLGVVLEPARLFSEYAYVSSASSTTVAHLGQLAATLRRAFRLGPSSRVLEIGSNDGTLLRRLARITPHVVGIDPARNVAALARAAGVPTVVDFFSSRTAARFEGGLAPFDLVLALNVVAHTPDFVDLLAGVRRVLAPTGSFVMECAYVLRTILAGSIDTVYHEHVYCFSLHALSAAAERVGLVIVDAEEIAVQGGSLRVVMRPRCGRDEPAPGVQALLRTERAAGVHRPETYAKVAGLARALREGVRAGVHRLRQRGDVVVGLGAPARGVVLMNYCGLSREDVDFVVDDTPLKQGKLVPGCQIPVAGWDRIGKDQRVVGLLLSWTYRAEMLAKLRARTSRAHVLVPLPTLEEVELG